MQTCGWDDKQGYCVLVGCVRSTRCEWLDMDPALKLHGRMCAEVICPLKELEALYESNANLRCRVNELELRLRIWRDDYGRCEGGTSVRIPVHQIINLIGE